MSEFNQVSIVKAANIYFDGNVISRTVKFEDGSRKTLGFMQAGEYQFGTEQAEIMEVFRRQCPSVACGSIRLADLRYR